MSAKVDQDAFTFYFCLGAGRSYQAVADEFGVSKQAISKRAIKERWQDRVEDLDRRGRERAEQQITETVEEMKVRHLKMLKLVQGRALEALKAMPLATSMDAVRALEMSMKQERLLRGEPTEHAVLTLEEVAKREHERWMSSTDSDEDLEVAEAAEE